MVPQPAQGGAGQQVIVKDLRPFPEGTVAGDNHRALFIAFTGVFVQVLGCLRRKRLQAEIVQNQEMDIQELMHQAWTGTTDSGGMEICQQAMKASRQDTQATLQVFQSQSIGQVAFAHACRPSHEHILVTLDENAGRQFSDERAIDGRSRREIQVGRGFLLLTARFLQVSGQTHLTAALQLIFKQKDQELHRRQLLLGCLVCPDL
jgi:hypothetical protein